MFGYIKKTEVLKIVQEHYNRHIEERSKLFEQIKDVMTSDEGGLDPKVVRDHLICACVSDAIYSILKDVEEL